MHTVCVCVEDVPCPSPLKCLLELVKGSVPYLTKFFTLQEENTSLFLFQPYLSNINHMSGFLYVAMPCCVFLV